VPSSAGIEVEQISKRFGALTALNNVSFAVAPGEALALLGPNGAGKTTLLRIVAGLSRPSSGTVRVGDVDLGASAELVRSQFGVVSHQTMLYEDLTASENLSFYGRLYGLDDIDGRTAGALQVVGLGDRADDRVRTFSRGMKQRLAIARATIHDPGFLLFDEPFTGLDVAGRDILTERIRTFRSDGRTAILVTHDLNQAVALADRFVMLVKGNVFGTGVCGEVGVEGLEEMYRGQR
jgi:heme exporter protein A